MAAGMVLCSSYIISAILVVAAIACNIAAMAVTNWLHWLNGHGRYWLFGKCVNYATGEICYSYHDIVADHGFIETAMACTTVTLCLSFLGLIALVGCGIIFLRTRKNANSGSFFNYIVFTALIFIVAACAVAFAAFGVWVYKWRLDDNSAEFDNTFSFGPGTWLILATAILLLLALLVLICFASCCDGSQDSTKKSHENEGYVLDHNQTGVEYNTNKGVSIVGTDRYHDTTYLEGTKDSRSYPSHLVVREGTTIAQDPEMEAHLHAYHKAAPVHGRSETVTTTRTNGADVVVVDRPEANREIEFVRLPTNAVVTENPAVTLDKRTGYEHRQYETEPKPVLVSERLVTSSEPVVNTVVDNRPLVVERRKEYDQTVVEVDKKVVTEHHVKRDQPAVDDNRLVYERRVLEGGPDVGRVTIEDRQTYEHRPLVVEKRIEHEYDPRDTEIAINRNTGVTEHHIIQDQPIEGHDEDGWRLLDPEPVTLVTDHHVVQDEPVVNEGIIIHDSDMEAKRNTVVTEHQFTTSQPMGEERRVVQEHRITESKPGVYERHIQVIDDRPIEVEGRVTNEHYVTGSSAPEGYDRKMMETEDKIVYNHHMHMRDGTRNSELVIMTAPPRPERTDKNESRTVETRLVVTNKEGNRQVHPVSVHSIDRKLTSHTNTAYTSDADINVCQFEENNL